MKESFRLTKHALDRLIERSARARQDFPILKQWENSSDKDKKDPTLYYEVIRKILKHSSENKSLINETGYMAEYFWDTYGFDSEYRFFEAEAYQVKLVFVKKRTSEHFTLVTVAPFFGKQKINKWAQMLSKEKKQTERTLQKFTEGQELIKTLLPSPRTRADAIEVSDEVSRELMRQTQQGHAKKVEKLDEFYTKYQLSLNETVYEYWYASLIEDLGVVSILEKDPQELAADAFFKGPVIEKPKEFKILIFSLLRSNQISFRYLCKKKKLIEATYKHKEYVLYFNKEEGPLTIQFFREQPVPEKES